MKISVVGLGKLGLCTAACFAAAGHDVFGYDHDTALGAALKAGQCPISETGLPDLLRTAALRLQVAGSYCECVEFADITLVIVPTHSLADGRFDHGAVLAVLEGLAPQLKKKDGFHIVDIVSTVMPGSCEQVFRPWLEQRTGKRCGIEFGLGYNPEFIALGSVVRDFLNPDLVLIGASDDRTAESLRRLYQSTVQTNPHIATMSLINAEICKLSLNCFVTMKISFANALAAICENVPGANIDAITSAMGADRRIGEKCLRGGLGFGGPCFPRDNRAFQAFAGVAGDRALLSESVTRINHQIPHRLRRTIQDRLSPPARIALLGMSYKAGTHIVEEAHSLVLARELVASGFRVSISDPAALDAVARFLEGPVDSFPDPYDCVREADAIILLTDWEDYRKLDWGRVASVARPNALVLDSWRIANGPAMAPFTYVALGIGPSVRS